MPASGVNPACSRCTSGYPLGITGIATLPCLAVQLRGGDGRRDGGCHVGREREPGGGGVRFGPHACVRARVCVCMCVCVRMRGHVHTCVHERVGVPACVVLLFDREESVFCEECYLHAYFHTLAIQDRPAFIATLPHMLNRELLGKPLTVVFRIGALA
jgi:hypothetical protein